MKVSASGGRKVRVVLGSAHQLSGLGCAHTPLTVDHRDQPQLKEICSGHFPWGLNGDVYPTYLSQLPGGEEKKKKER